MTLVKTQFIDKYEIVGPFKMIQCRQATVVSEDDKVLSTTYARVVLTPRTDLTNLIDEVKAIAAAVHTPEVLKAYDEYVAEKLEAMENKKDA